jgi:glycosyltransferase involved in cell wall biosynthesis
VKVAYLFNRYPMPSQTFIRREVLAMEASGTPIERFTIRPTTGEIVDPSDQAEAARTRVVLEAGTRAITLAIARTVLRSPRTFVRALLMAVSLGYRSSRGILVHFAYLAEACVVREWAEEERITHIHVHFGTNPTTVAMLCKALGGPPFSVTIHGQEEFDRPEALKLREKVREATFAIAISDYGRAQVLRWCDQRDWHKVHVVRCGVDESYLVEHDTPIPDRPRFVCVSRLQEHKGLALLIEAVMVLRGEGREVELVLAGEGPSRDELEALIARSLDPEAVTLTGWQDNQQIRGHMLGSRATVLPSFAEGLPIVIMESLALARPVIATRVGAVGELVDDSCGWLVPPATLEPLVDALRAALDTPVDRLEEMGAEGRRRVRERHDAQRGAQLVAKLLASADGGQAGRPEAT